MPMKIIYLISIPHLLLSACNPFRLPTTESACVVKEPDAQTFTMPVIPAYINTSDEREVYLAKHYWENLDFSLVNGKFDKAEITDRFVDYLDLLAKIPREKTRVSINCLLDRAVQNPDSFHYFVHLFERYLNGPQSSLKNEEWYILVLEYIVHSPNLDEVNKIRAKYQLKMLYKNKLGSVATDFNFANPAGERGSLNSLEAPYILILFYGMDCRYCHTTIAALRNNILLKRLQQEEELKVLSVYTQGKSKLWLDHAPLMPKNWVNVSDRQQITLHKTYYLRVLPSLYLLDRNKKVLLKNTSVEDLLNYLCNERN